MDLRLSELEKRAFTEIDGQTTLRIEGAGDGTETPVPSVRLSQLQRDAFTLVDGQVAVRVTGTTGGGGGSCTIRTQLDTTLFGWDNSGNPNINFSVDNTGFQWDLELGQTDIIALCDNMLVTPLPTTTGGMGDLTVSSILLDDVNITGDVTVDTTTADTIKLNYNTKIINPNLTGDNNFTVKLNLLLGTTAVPEITRTLTYLRPQYNLSVSRANVNYNLVYGSATATRSFPRGAPTAFISTRINNQTQTIPGETNLTFPNLNRFASATERTLTDVATFTNATNNTTTNITQTALLTVTFEFPVYLGSVTTTSGLNTADVNNTALFSQIGTFTSRPGSMNFTWPTNSNPIKIFGIANDFFNGMINFKANSSSVVGNVQSPFIQISTGVNSAQRADYNYYEAQDGQPGGVTLFVEFL